MIFIRLVVLMLTFALDCIIILPSVSHELLTALRSMLPPDLTPITPAFTLYKSSAVANCILVCDNMLDPAYERMVSPACMLMFASACRFKSFAARRFMLPLPYTFILPSVVNSTQAVPFLLMM